MLWIVDISAEGQAAHEGQMPKPQPQHTHPFADLSRYGIEQPFLSDAEIAHLLSIRGSPAWLVIAKTRAHLLTIYGRRSVASAKAHNPEAFRAANIAEGIEIFYVVLEALTRGEPVPDIYMAPAVTASASREYGGDDL